MQSKENRQRLAALAGTVAFHALLLAVLLTAFLRFDPTAASDREWPPVDSAEILLGGEYVVIGNDPSMQQSAADPAPEGAEADEAAGAETQAPDLTDGGKAGEAAVAVASTRPSPAVTPEKKRPEVTGPAKDTDGDKQRAKQNETTRQVNSQVAGAFAGKPATTPSGGSPDGNTSTGAATEGTPGADMGGRTMAHWVKAKGQGTGVITVTVTVDSSGKVTSASYNPGRSKGSVAANAAARSSCINAARQCRFSVATDGPATQRGTISFNFK